MYCFWFCIIFVTELIVTIMILKRISILNYKNLEQVELTFSPKLNCFFGQNGMGKTNLLDAVYFLSFCKSAINSERATQFRTWATKVLDTFTKQGYVLDKSRLINGQIFDEDYFEHLIAEIQEIRASERRFYQKITDIYATAVDYDKNSQMTREFYATVQNKMHYAVHGNTAEEVIVARADHNKEHMGLKSWKNAPDGKIVKTDVSIAKNYLEKEELAELNEIVTMYLDYATRQARRHIPMTMEDWKTKLDAFLRFNDAEVLQDKGKVTAAIAKEFAESEFEKYRVIQDSLYESDFDKLMNDMEKNDAIH